MKYVIISDIHSNLEALSSVLADIKAQKLDKSNSKNICLGDIVGYGPNPNECTEATLDLVGDNVVIGNHDRSAAWRIVNDLRHMGEQFIMNQNAEWSLDWTAKNLNDKYKTRLVDLVKSDKYKITEENLIFAHATPYSSEKMYYIESGYDAFSFFFGEKSSKGKVAFVGHRHQTQLYAYDGKKVINFNREMLSRKEDERTSKIFPLANYESSLVVLPGLGQPRDKNNKTGYVIYDSDLKSIEFIRLPYDFRTTQQKMEGFDLPELLIEILELGR